MRQVRAGSQVTDAHGRSQEAIVPAATATWACQVTGATG